MSTTTFLVDPRHLERTQVEVREDAPLAAGQIRVRVERFALTANNITYAAFGEAMHYWRFFPSGSPDWGIVPVWGFGTVTQSLHPGVAVGERLYGFWPMASDAVLQPGRLNEARLTDAAPHRTELPAVYNDYLRCSADPFYPGVDEGLQALLRPLFATSWLIDDFLAEADFFGTRTVLLSSASSKTAWSLAQLLSSRAGLAVVGLTSGKNQAYCESLGCYSQVLAYQGLDAMPADTPCVYVDFAGSASLRRHIHERFGQLAYSCSVGGTHVAELGSAQGLPGPRPTLFFAPAQMKKRQADWGPGELVQRMVGSWRTFSGQVARSAPPWLTVREQHGGEAVRATYAQVLAGASDPRQGEMLRLAS